MKLYRSLDGKTIHAETCPRRGGALWWQFATDMTAADVRRLMTKAPWLKTCRSCKPLDKEVQS